ncbi:MAG: helix-turn-helix domain-containing protein, partial [Pseudomonadales bacterium]|nr:helix-turn-helix domain-containing protein [Pseudomonadales bacterium]
AGRYQIHSWGPVDKAWIGQHLAQIKQVLGYP